LALGFPALRRGHDIWHLAPGGMALSAGKRGTRSRSRIPSRRTRENGAMVADGEKGPFLDAPGHRSLDDRPDSPYFAGGDWTGHRPLCMRAKIWNPRSGGYEI